MDRLLLWLALFLAAHHAHGTTSTESASQSSSTASISSTSETTPKPLRKVTVVEQLAKQQPTTLAPYRTMKTKVPPANYTGPAPFRELLGQCFHSQQGAYDYTICPFDNVTQVDVVTRWNPYKGVLGVFETWEVKDGLFYSVLFRNGDACGTRKREFRITFECDTENSIGEVSEPNTCSYTAILKTPTACGKALAAETYFDDADSKLELQKIKDELYDEEITQQGFDKRVRKLLVAKGLLAEQIETPKEKEETTTTAAPVTVRPHSRYQPKAYEDPCAKERDLLRAEVEKLRAEIAALTGSTPALPSSLESTTATTTASTSGNASPKPKTKKDTE